MRVAHIPQLFGWIALSLAAGAIGSLATAGNVEGWYATLAKPAWNPPNWVFAPVWTTLYVLMGVAASLIADLLKRFFWIAYIGLAIIAWVAITMIWEGGHEVITGRHEPTEQAVH